MTVDVAVVRLVVVLVNLLEGSDVVGGSFIRDDVAVEIDFFNAFEFQAIGDDAFDSISNLKKYFVI